MSTLRLLFPLILFSLTVHAPLSAEVPRSIGARNVYGIHTLAPGSEGAMGTQLTWARLLVGDDGYVAQPISPVGAFADEDPLPKAVAFVQRAYASGLNPILVLQGEFSNRTGCNPSRIEGWLKPVPDDPEAATPSYSLEADAYRGFVAQLPRADGRSLMIEVWNEPNLNYMWGGAANAAEYARFLVDVSAAIHSIGDDRVKVLNAGLAPEGDVDNLQFLEQAIQTEPGFSLSFDFWASHPYPHNQPPANNLHDGTALPGSRYSIDAYLLELDLLRRYGIDTTDLQVVLTETGYELGNAWYPSYSTINEQNRAEFIKQALEEYWSRWPEVRAVTPFQLVDTGGSWKEFEWIRPTSGADASGFPSQARLQYARLLHGTGVVAGTIRDGSGNSLKGVTVSASANSHQAITTQGGSFIMIAYPGAYQLTADKPGYVTGSANDVVVTEGGLRPVDFTLESNLPPVVRNPSGESGELDNWTPFGDVDGVQRGPWYNGIEAKDGRYFLGTASNCVEKDGGYYQSIATTPGSNVKVSVWALTYKEGTAPMGNRLGVDPTGGTNPESADVVWSPWLETGGRWKKLSVEATTRSEMITIFLQNEQDQANSWNINAFDALEATFEP